MATASEILRDFNQAPGFGEKTEVIPERDPSPPPAGQTQSKRDGVLGEVEKLAEKQADEAGRRYLATVKAFVSGEADAPTIQAATEAAGKTIADFEADATICRDRFKLLEIIATEAAEQAKLDDYDAAIREAERQRHEAAKRLLQAKADADKAEQLKQAAEREQWSIKQRLAEIDNATRRLQQSPFSQFASGEETNANERLADIDKQLSAAHQQRNECFQQAAELREAMAKSQTRLRHVQGIDLSLSSVEIPHEEFHQRQIAQSQEIETLQGEIKSLSEQLQQAEQAESEAAARIETLEAEAAEARDQFTRLLA